MPNPTAPNDSAAAVTESLYLREDGQTACWKDAHVSAAVGAILLLVLYSAGFPLFCFVLLTRAFANEHSTGFIGWLRRHVSWLRSSNHPHYAVDVRVDDTRPGLDKQPSVAASAELLYAAKLQRRRESVHTTPCTHTPQHSSHSARSSFHIGVVCVCVCVH
jgi:hypothetical protein